MGEKYGSALELGKQEYAHEFLFLRKGNVLYKGKYGILSCHMNNSI